MERFDWRTRQERWQALANTLDLSTQYSVTIARLLRRAAECEPSLDTADIFVELATALRDTAALLVKTAADFERGNLN